MCQDVPGNPGVPGGTFGGAFSQSGGTWSRYPQRKATSAAADQIGLPPGRLLTIQPPLQACATVRGRGSNYPHSEPIGRTRCPSPPAMLTYLLPAVGTRNSVGCELPVCSPFRKDPLTSGAALPGRSTVHCQPSVNLFQTGHTAWPAGLELPSPGALRKDPRTCQPSGGYLLFTGDTGDKLKNARKSLSSLRKAVPGSTGGKRKSAGDTGDK
jgi:hypothetical protein